MERKIQEDIMNAMKEKNQVSLSALRAVKTAITQYKTSPNFKGNRNDFLSDVEVLKIMQKLVKEREDSYNIYKSAGRDDLADKEKSEMLIIKEYLPKPLTEAEIVHFVDEAISEINATTMKDMGNVIKLVKQKTNGRADGSIISKIVKECLK